jgi:hypothetical protein
MPARTKNASQLVLSKPIPCQGGSSHANEDAKSTSTSVVKTPPVPTRTLNEYQNDASGYTKFNSTCVDQTPTMTARTQNASQHELNKPLIHKMYFTMCRSDNSYASEDSKYN